MVARHLNAVASFVIAIAGLVCPAAAQEVGPAAGVVQTSISPSMPLGLQQVASVRSLSQCVNQAAQFHGVSPWILAAILRHESRLKPDAINYNKNGSVDVGIGQVNSVHWNELARFGIAPADLLNPCVGTFVAAHELSKRIARWGNTWWAVGAYHSNSPVKNARYRVAIWNELVDMGAVSGPKFFLKQ